MTLVLLSLVLFVAAVVFSVLGFVRRLASGTVSRPLGYVHGILATAAFVVLVIYYAAHVSSGPEWAARFLVVSAIIGFVFFGIHLARSRPPLWLGILHGVLALAGLVLLFAFALAAK
jgi:hypothetical protein